MISIRDAIHTYAATRRKTWEHDRGKTVGASEIGQCARKTWFSKNDAPRDPEYQDNWGAQLRGAIIEDHLWMPALRATLPEGVRLLFAGEEQQTFFDGYLSATPDGLLVWPNGYCIDLDNKSFDPRIDIQKEKSEHSFQVQAQIGAIRATSQYQPEEGIISYINASWFDDIREYPVKWNPRIYAAAQVRAEEIMTARDALELSPEGKMAGGKECEWCAWASHCADVTVAGVPTNDVEMLPYEEIVRLEVLVNSAREAAQMKEDASGQHAQAQEAIKQFLREHNIRRYKGDGWSVSYSAVSGRATYDFAAIERAGIDLSSYTKTGSPSERLYIR
jgi:hypothetical protein